MKIPSWRTLLIGTHLLAVLMLAGCGAFGGPEADGSAAEYAKYGSNRLAEGKLPLCAEMCSTKALLAGDGQIIASIYRERVLKRGYGSGAWGWRTAYKETVAT